MTNEKNGYNITVDFELGIIEQCLQNSRYVSYYNLVSQLTTQWLKIKYQKCSEISAFLYTESLQMQNRFCAAANAESTFIYRLWNIHGLVGEISSWWCYSTFPHPFLQKPVLM